MTIPPLNRVVPTRRKGMDLSRPVERFTPFCHEFLRQGD
jgi:hypothetical protein